MRHSSLALTAFLLSLAFVSPANATFSVTNTNADGSVTSGAYPSFELTGGDNGSGEPGSTVYSDIFASDGIMTFDWSYFSTDDPSFDSAGYILNGVETQLADTSGEFGTGVAVGINAGDTFGWYVDTTDNLFGPGVLTVDAAFTPSVPEPITLALFGAGLSGIVALRRRRKSKT